MRLFAASLASRFDDFAAFFAADLVSKQWVAARKKAGLPKDNHPGWFWFAAFCNAYRQSDYLGALDVAMKIDMPGFWRNNVALAAAYGQLGEQEDGRNALRALLALRPDFAVVAREELGKWWDPDLVEHLIDGLRKAGLEIAPESGAAPSKPATKTGS